MRCSHHEPAAHRFGPDKAPEAPSWIGQVYGSGAVRCLTMCVGVLITCYATPSSLGPHSRLYCTPHCCTPPPLVVPHPLSFPGGGGGASLGQPKFFRCGSLWCCVGDCVVGHCHFYPLHSWQDILLTFAEMELDSTTVFPPGTSVMFIRSPGEPVFAQVVRHSEHGDAYRRITYDRDSKTVLHDRASFRRLSLPRAPSPRRVYGGGAVPQGGGGGPSLGDRPPRGGGGPSSLGWGTTRGGGVSADVPGGCHQHLRSYLGFTNNSNAGHAGD